LIEKTQSGSFTKTRTNQFCGIKFVFLILAITTIMHFWSHNTWNKVKIFVAI
jgi:hypothetical protein